MKATANNGHEWTGERDGEWWIYTDESGNLYESKEVPAYRITLDNAVLGVIDGKRCIMSAGPISDDWMPDAPDSVAIEARNPTGGLE